MPDALDTTSGYGPLLKDGPFEAFLWTQFLGAFNDNVFKMIVSVFAVSAAAGTNISSRNLALAGAVFVIPFLLFAGYSGQLTDRFSKTRVLQVTKSFEIVTMLLAIAALLAGRIEYLLVVLFLLATQANFFSPAKYGILPEMLGEAQLTRANGLLELTTFVAIVIGTSFGTFLFQHWQATPLRMGLALLAIAVTGSLASLGIRKVPAQPAPANPSTGTRSTKSSKAHAYSGGENRSLSPYTASPGSGSSALSSSSHYSCWAPRFSMSTKPKWAFSSQPWRRASGSAASAPARSPGTTLSLVLSPLAPH